MPPPLTVTEWFKGGGGLSPVGDEKNLDSHLELMTASDLQNWTLTEEQCVDRPCSQQRVGESSEQRPRPILKQLVS